MSVAFLSLVRASADLLPGSPVRNSPNLRASGRELNHGAIAKFRISRASDVKHKNTVGNTPADANRATRVKGDLASASRECVSVQRTHAYTQGCGDGPRAR